MPLNEWKALIDLAAVYRLTDYYGWTSVVYNHITLRIPDSDTFLINPFGLRYDEIKASNLVKIDLDGNKLDGSEWPINQAAYNIHSAIHTARNKDLHCVMHTHEPMSQTISALKDKVIPMFQEACQLYERVGYHDFEGIVLYASEKKRLVKSLGKSAPLQVRSSAHSPPPRVDQRAVRLSRPGGLFRRS